MFTGYVTAALSLLALSFATLALAEERHLYQVVKRATVTEGQCYTESNFVECYKTATQATDCLTLQAGVQRTACACSVNTLLFSCYTSLCASDKYYATYSAGIDACKSLGFGGPAPAPATATGGGAAGGGGGAATTTAPGGGVTQGSGGSGAAQTSKNGGPALVTQAPFVGAAMPVLAAGLAAWGL